jgi:hypothetical protein
VKNRQQSGDEPGDGDVEIANRLAAETVLVPAKNQSASGESCLTARWRLARQNATIKVAANTPHTITNALMICFSSETDIARFSTTPVLGTAGVVTLMRARRVRAVDETHAQAY